MTATRPQRGDVFLFPAASNAAVRVVVTRVARDNAWADIHCTDLHTNAVWTKRQPLPIPGDQITAQIGGTRRDR